MLSLKTEADLLREVADLLRAHRLTLGWRQTDLAARSGVAIATLRRFERSGQIGFRGLAKLLVSLGLVDTFLAAFNPPVSSPKSITAFLEDKPTAKRPQRARRPVHPPK